MPHRNLRSSEMKLSIKKMFNVNKAISLTLILSFILSNVLLASAAGDVHNASSVSSTMAKFTTDLTQLGREGRLRENPNFDKETARLIEVLANGGEQQPVIVDETGEVQGHVVDQLALRIAKNNVSKTLEGVTVLKLETAALFSNNVSAKELEGATSAIVDV